MHTINLNIFTANNFLKQLNINTHNTNVYEQKYVLNKSKKMFFLFVWTFWVWQWMPLLHMNKHFFLCFHFHNTNVTLFIQNLASQWWRNYNSYFLHLTVLLNSTFTAAFKEGLHLFGLLIYFNYVIMYDKRIFTRPELPVLLGILRASPTALEVDGMGSIVLSVCSSVKFREGAHMMFEWTNKSILFHFTRHFSIPKF